MHLVQRTGRVAAHDGHSVRISFDKLGDCANCKLGFGCGIGPVVGMMKSSCEMYLSAADPKVENLAPGDVVSVGIDARQLALQALLTYLLPLIGLVLGGLCAVLIVPRPDDLNIGIGALAGMIVAYLGICAARYSFDLDIALQPQILRRSIGR